MDGEDPDLSRRLEEQLAFQEREVELCRDQIVELWRALGAAQRRIERLEQLLSSAPDEGDGDDEPE